MHDISTCETGIGDYSLYLGIPRDFNLIASSNKVCCIKHPYIERLCLVSPCFTECSISDNGVKSVIK